MTNKVLLGCPKVSAGLRSGAAGPNEVRRRYSVLLPQLKEIGVDIAGARLRGATPLSELSRPILIPGKVKGVLE